MIVSSIIDLNVSFHLSNDSRKEVKEVFRKKDIIVIMRDGKEVYPDEAI